MMDDLNSLWLTHNKRVDHAAMVASIEESPVPGHLRNWKCKKVADKLKVDLNHTFKQNSITSYSKEVFTRKHRS